MSETQPTFRWGRLVLHEPSDGAWNMAVDEVLLEHPEPGTVCMRWYGWQPATLSLGYFQALGERDQHRASRDCPLVRRASGGGAILHDQELTYSVVVPQPEGGHLDTQWVYDLMHDSLRDALAIQGIAVEKCDDGNRTDPTRPAFLCFQRHCPGDLLLGRHKVVGSAQRRTREAVLQHGSILLRQSPFAPELPGIEDLAAVGLSTDRLQADWLAAVGRRLAIEWHSECLTSDEKTWVAAKRSIKFGSTTWTQRR